MKVKIHLVDALFVGPGFRTEVWVSELAQDSLRKWVKSDDGRRFLSKLRFYAQAGFEKFEEKGPIRHEWDGVWRVAHARASLFRLTGFYEGHKGSFIVVDAFRKRGQKLSKAERERINQVVKVKRLGAWKKRGAPGGQQGSRDTQSTG